MLNGSLFFGSYNIMLYLCIKQNNHTMSKKVDHYNVELRVHFERNGEDDYTEDDYEFPTKKEAMTFANENAGECHDVREYYTDGDSKSIW